MKLRYERQLELACVAALVVLFVVQGILSARLKSLTRDEYVYLAAAVAETEFGHYGFLPHQPPYSKLVSGAFLLPLDLDVRAPPDTDAKAAKYPYAHALLRGNRNKIGAVSLMARLPHILLGGLLAIGVWYVVRSIFGKAAGLAAAFLYVTDPNVLAHARLLHTDSDSAAFVFLAVAGLVLVLRGRPSWRISAATAVFFGLALLAKYSALALVAIFPALAIFWIVLHIGMDRSSGKEAGRALTHWDLRPKLIRVALAILVIVPLLALVFYRGQVTWYFKGLGMVLGHAQRGHPAYLMGEWSDHGWWYYFPVVLAVKAPVPLLILGLAGIVYIVRGLFSTRSILGIMFVLAFGLWLGGAMTGSVNLGLRHILPAYVFLFVCAGAAVQSWSGNRIGRVVVAVLLVWTAVSAYRVFPDYIPYFNEFAGGPESGERYLADSNLDWGQEMISLKRYMDEQGIPEIVLCAMGAPIPDIYGIRRLRLDDAQPTPDKPVYCAMGATFRAEFSGREPSERSRIEAFLSNCEEMATLGHSLTVFRVSRPFPEALRRRRI